MSNDVVLSAALRNNLLSLQHTQGQIDVHQNRLATGKKVNSALDNPQSFFAAQTLTNRANDLSNLLDALGQSIQVINAANNGVTALTTLINQAQSVANTAQSTLAGSSTQAQVTGSVNLGTGKLSLLAGVNGGTSELQISVTDPTTGLAIALPSAAPNGDGSNAGSIVIGASDTASDLVTRINDLNTNLSSPVVSASLDSSGHLVITATNNGTLNVKFGDTSIGAGAAHFAGGSGANNTTNLALASALGFAGIAKLNQNGAAATNASVDFTQTASSTLTSKGLYTASGVVAQGSSTLNSLTDSTGGAGTVVKAGGNNAADTLTISVGGHTSADLLHYSGLTAATSTIQSVVDAINHDSNINSLVSASFNTTTGQISLSPLTSDATDAQIKFTGAAAGDQLSLGFGLSTFAAGTGSNTEDIRFGAAAGTLASLQSQYNTTLSQIDALVKDTGYAGTNLLNGNSLTTFFNETRTTSLTTQGVTFTRPASA
jgi:flagellin